MSTCYGLTYLSISFLISLSIIFIFLTVISYSSISTNYNLHNRLVNYLLILIFIKLIILLFSNFVFTLLNLRMLSIFFTISIINQTIPPKLIHPFIDIVHVQVYLLNRQHQFYFYKYSTINLKLEP